MTANGTVNDKTKVSLAIKDYLIQIGILVAMVSGFVFWVSSLVADERKADAIQDTRLSLIESDVSRAHVDVEAVNATLNKLNERLEALSRELSSISAGVARIDERTRRNTP
ncbi:MAG: hypothetical protein LW822_09500 [Phycisphaeraceae bacterium]|jgi:septal ring factor EnvC (AmiA/AmiB activator)|nr:hypothetical protein [Phycisphaeraceae bacterium]